MASRSWNRVELIGNLTRDPELRYTPNGAAVCTFGVATNRTYISEGERKEEVDFHRCVSWNKLAELCKELLKKGTKVFVSGRLQNRTWEGQDGQQRQTTEIVIEDMIVLSPKVNGEAQVATGEPNIEEIPTTTKAAKTEEAESFNKPQEKQEKKEPKKPKNPPQEEIDEEKDLPF